MTELFVRQEFVMHSGGIGHWKIECDALTDDEIATLALMLFEVLPPFGNVIGIPRGGIRLQDALLPYATEGNILIVDDVLTTGRSMEEKRNDIRLITGTDPIGAVLFARSKCPPWITPLFQMPMHGGEGVSSE